MEASYGVKIMLMAEEQLLHSVYLSISNLTSVYSLMALLRMLTLLIPLQEYSIKNNKQENEDLSIFLFLNKKIDVVS
jgi:hypothetical protein